MLKFKVYKISPYDGKVTDVTTADDWLLTPDGELLRRDFHNDLDGNWVSFLDNVNPSVYFVKYVKTGKKNG
jgi:hypothetical protein